MKKGIIALFSLLCVAVSSTSGQAVIEAVEGEASCVVKNPNSYDVTDAPVVLSVKNPQYRSAVVFVGNKEVPSQLDVLDNGTTRELAFVVDLKAGQSKKVKIIFSESLADPTKYRSRVNAQMFLKENGQIVPKEVIAAPEDNMYNKLHHHGPAIESELAAYRIYFDKKQTVDIYGKVIKRIELPVTMWYPTDQQLVDKYGDDVLYVGGSVGVGALKGWDGSSAIHIEPMTQREAKILAKGPVRAIMEMNVDNWEYNGQKINMTSRYTIYAGHRDAEVLNRISGNGVQNMEFATGVQKLRKGDVNHIDGKGMAADWGRDFPVTDTVKYPMQTVGLGISIPSKYVVKQANDKLNYLYVVKPDANNEIRYRITFGAEKEEFGYKSPEAFFKYVDVWKDEQPIVVTIKAKK